MLEMVGYLGGFLVAVSLSPQLIKTYKTKSAKDISLLWTSIILTGLILYAIYAAANNILPLLTFAIVESVMVITLMSMKISYDKKSRM